MKCKILNAGYMCSDEKNDYFTYLCDYVGVLVCIYKPKLIFKGYKKDKYLHITLVEGRTSDICIKKATEYFYDMTEDMIMDKIIDKIKSHYGVSEEDIKTYQKIDDINNKFNSLIGKEFEIDI